MAKDKSKTPKAIGGVKVPKKLRRATDKVQALASNPIVSEVVATALIAAAASLAETKAGKKARREAGDAAEALAGEGAAIGASVKKALLDAARSLIDTIEDEVVKPAKAAKKG